MQSLAQGFQSYENRKEKDLLRALEKYGATDPNTGIDPVTLADALGINPEFILSPISELNEQGLIEIITVPQEKGYLGDVAISLTSTGVSVQKMFR